ncbi:hypothetical protein ACPPVO_36395 [Dactylosporangium sp. McL0621]|uniref:hypothetical protein n=1 Tax=Dactylosporangium sp. McL0621 TaxID=3415678 RepID=UPI003CEFA8ED
MTQPDQYTLPEQPMATPVERPKALFGAAGALIGLRAASTRLAGGSRLVDVWLYDDPPAGLTDPALWTLRPAPGAPRPSVTAVTSEPASSTSFGTPIPAHLTLTLDSVLPGRGVYQLRLDPAGLTIDPLRVFLPVRLRPECGDAGDITATSPRPAPLTPPDYDTLARDYTALRVMLLERLSFADPAADQSIADLTVTMIELFAHLGDLLHYRLDRAATEAWLSTARRRSSVVRHARAVDFPVRPAVSARTTVQVVVGAQTASDPSVTVQPGALATDSMAAAASGQVPIMSSDACFTLENDQPVTFFSSHAEVALHDWTEDDAELSVGATSAVLVRPALAAALPLATWLPPGCLIGFEVVGVEDRSEHRAWTAGAADRPSTDPAAPWPRPPLASVPAQVVTMTSAVEFTDPLHPAADLIRVFWGEPEALAIAVPCSVDNRFGQRAGVARLGLLPAHHGLTVDGPATLAPVDRLTGLPADPLLSVVSDYDLVAAGPEAAPGLSHDVDGRPWELDVTVGLPNGTRVPATRVTSMLRATPSGFSVVVDADDELPARLRFRTGTLGVTPPAGSEVRARYQIGAGPAGNVAANITHRLLQATSPVGDPCAWADVTDSTGAPAGARNLTPGRGGALATSLDDVKRDAPQAYSAVSRRAVLIGDLPGFALQVPPVSRASAQRSWSGSWPVGVVAYEADDDASPDLLRAAVQATLDGARMIGTEVVTATAVPVGLLLALTVCLFPGSEPESSRAAILSALRPGTPAARGLFAPGSFPMGTGVFVSNVVAAVAALPQVDAVAVTQARRLSEPDGTLRPFLAMGPAEMAVCDDDPGAPDRGRILLTVEGGR